MSTRPVLYFSINILKCHWVFRLAPICERFHKSLSRSAIYRWQSNFCHIWLFFINEFSQSAAWEIWLYCRKSWSFSANLDFGMFWMGRLVFCIFHCFHGLKESKLRPWPSFLVSCVSCRKSAIGYNKTIACNVRFRPFDQLLNLFSNICTRGVWVFERSWWHLFGI